MQLITRVQSNVSAISGIRAYEQLGNRAFGPPGKMLAACIITVHNIGGILQFSFIYFFIIVALSAVSKASEGMRRWFKVNSLIVSLTF